MNQDANQKQDQPDVPEHIEEQLRYRIALEGVITELATNFINVPSGEIDSGVTLALGIVGSFIGADRSFIFILSEDRKTVSNTHEWCADGVESEIRNFQNIRVADYPLMEQGLFGTEPVHIPSVANLPPEMAREKATFEQESVKSFVALPMTSHGKPIGFLGFETVSREKAWSEDSVLLLRIMGEVFANALARKRAEEAIRESEEKYRLLVEMMDEGLARADSDYVFSYVNQRFADMLGRTPEEMIGHPLTDFVHPDSREILAEQTERRKKGESGRYELDWRSKDGRKVHTLASPRPMFDETGRFAGSVAVLTDITDRKRAEEALQRSEGNLRAIFDCAPAAIFAYDRNATVLQANTAMEKLYGIRREDLVGRSMFETFARTEDRAKTEQIIARVFSGESVDNLEWQDLRSDGSAVFVVTSTTPVYDPDGKVMMGLSLNVDITERKMAEQRRRELEEHKREFYRSTILAATDGKLVISERGEIERIAGAAIGQWCVKSGERLGAIRHALTKIGGSLGMDEERVYDLALCAGEATTNALKHAGQGRASLHKCDGSVMLVVSDEGPGIEALSLPEVALVRGYSTAGSLGMGYKTMLAVADKVYLATSPDGTTVAVELAIHPAETIVISAFGLPESWTEQ